MAEKKVIKIDDPDLKELMDKTLGYRVLLDELALRRGQITKAFWKRAAELYGLDLKNKIYRVWIHTYEIEEV